LISGGTGSGTPPLASHLGREGISRSSPGRGSKLVQAQSLCAPQVALRVRDNQGEPSRCRAGPRSLIAAEVRAHCASAGAWQVVPAVMWVRRWSRSDATLRRLGRPGPVTGSRSRRRWPAAAEPGGNVQHLEPHPRGRLATAHIAARDRERCMMHASGHVEPARVDGAGLSASQALQPSSCRDVKRPAV
jgi:hypothetical protein